MDDFKAISETSPISIGRQIEILKMAKCVFESSCLYNMDEITRVFVDQIPRGFGNEITRGLCCVIGEIILQDTTNQIVLRSIEYERKTPIATLFIPCFTKENALKSNTNARENDDWAFWWDISYDRGSITNRIAFLDWLINKLEETQK